MKTIERSTINKKYKRITKERQEKDNKRLR